MAVDSGRSRRLGFVAATVALVAAFAASAAPIPLYGIYRASDGLTYGDLSLTAVAYFAGAVTSLLVFGRLSNHLGRRPVILLSLGLAAIASLILLDVPNVMPLILGRVLLGLACGLASSATAAFLIDNAPANPPWLGAAISSSAPMIGLTIGALGSGTLAEYGTMPRTLPYLGAVAILLAGACLIVMSHETVPRQPGALLSLRPTIGLPRASRRLFPVASCTFVATWALGGFYQAFGPSMATDQFGSSNALVSAAVFSSLMAPSAIAGPLAGRLSPAGAQRVGMVAFTLAAAGVLLSLHAAAVVPFLAASALAGAAQGATLTGSIRALLARALPDERAGAFAVIFATSYSGAAIPSFVAGQFSRSMNLLDIASGYGALALAACAVTLFAARNPD
ncbi:MAG: MFS transporter [Shinella sp.]|nr:MFS transporter [Shinella sp.]